MSHVKIEPLRGMAIALLAIVMPLSFLLSCSGDKKDLIEIVFDPQTSYTLLKKNTDGLVSDSGITRYKITTETWIMFSKATEPYWYFPDGAYLEKFDTTFNIEASIKADTAYYYERSKIWKLDGNVDISNLKGERFQTSQLFWDSNNGTIYSDSFIRITKGESENTGYGFLSNEDMSEYKIFSAKADFPIDMKRNTTAAGDSIPADSSGIEVAPATITINEPDSTFSGNNNSTETK